MSVRDRWINVFYRAATGNKRFRAIVAPLGAVCFFTVLGLLAWLFVSLDRWLGLPEFLSWPYNVVIAVPILAIGSLLVVWCNIRFLKAHGTPVPFNPPQELVENGPYAVTRNPMLTGMFFVLFGIGALLGSVCLTFLFTPGFILLMTFEVKYIEEPELEKRLGAPYVEYRRRVPMFFPRFMART